MFPKKKILLLGTIILALFLTSSSIQADDIPPIPDYTIEGNSVFIEDEQASLRVTPHTARYPSSEGYQQEFEICNKTDVDTTLYGAYLFDYNLLQGKAEYLSSEDYEWVEHRKWCSFIFDYNENVNPAPNIHQGECYYLNSEEEKIVEFDIAFKSVEANTIQYDVNELVKNWTNVTSSFQKKEVFNKTAYIYTNGKNVLANSCETWRITYEPTENSSGKWDLWLWVGETANCILTDTCLKTLKLDPWWDGAGSEGDPFIIEDCNHLENIGSYLGLTDVYFELGNDIDCSEHGDFESIGVVDVSYFYGHLDGKNHLIKNVTVNETAPLEAGLFAKIGYWEITAEIKNIGLIDFNIYNSDSGAGALAGRSESSHISNVYVQGATIEATQYVGGLISQVAYPASEIVNCYITDTNVTTTGNFSGGLAGYMYDTNLFHSYSSAKVSGNGTSEGGLIGIDDGSISVVTNSYWDTETSGQAESALGTGLTTANMFKEASFVNWDFSTIWEIEEDVSYPTLQSFFTPPTDSCSCPASGHWQIVDGDNCSLSTECNLSAGNLHIVEGQLTITSTGTLIIPSGYYAFIQQDNNLHIEKGGKLFVAK